MKLEDFVNKTVILQLRDASIVKGILVEIQDIDSEDECETRLSIRINSNEYRLIDINEIETIGELI